MATHSSILACKIPWTQKPGGLQCMGSKRVTRLSTHAGTCHVLRVFLKSGSSSTLARLIPQQSSKDDYPYFKSETFEAQSLSNLRGDVQLVGCNSQNLKPGLCDPMVSCFLPFIDASTEVRVRVNFAPGVPRSLLSPFHGISLIETESTK